MGIRLTQTTANPLVIAASGSTSNAISDISDATHIAIYGPSALDQTINVEVAHSLDSTATFYPLLSAGSNVTVTAAKATVITVAGFVQIRVKTSTSTESAQRTFTITKQIDLR